MKTLSDNLATLLAMGCKQAGSYVADQALSSVQEHMTQAEFEAATKFLNWLVKEKRTFGHNLPEVWAAYQASNKGLPVLDPKLVRKNAQEFVNNIPRDFQNLPVFEHSYKSRPSWKSYGEGHARIKITRSRHGFDFQASEYPESIRGGKEVFVSVPAEKAAELKSFVCEDLVQALNEIAQYAVTHSMTNGVSVPIKEMARIAKEALKGMRKVEA